jgi:hypothetical protein
LWRWPKPEESKKKDKKRADLAISPKESLNLKVSKGPEETTLGKLSFSMFQIIPSKSGFSLGFKAKALN